MRYMGNKSRLAKYILPIVLDGRNPEQYYVEPFCGSCGMMQYVDGNRIASDSNKYLMAMHIAISDGWIPPSFISESDYYAIKSNKENYPMYLVGFVGFGCSYGGRWFEGYARGGQNSNGTNRNYCLESRNSLLVQSKSLANVSFFCATYESLNIPPKSIIYCDPPYQDTKQYKDKFDHVTFWDWARQMHGQGHSVFVSEYNAPADFTAVWEKTVNSSLTKDTGAKQNTEKLFTLSN